ncbi:hypothetical protein C7M84_024713 [Penaeus vannamei]|uniref:Structural maintenance of chromosomes protein 5 n=1 Tax=Penaeus vannamei TaxID=6689 RepID=A0A3R7QXM2_PENVA|nr:hypothetical protein C7M84_024713 [Penaeus vannamei]
MRKKNLNIIPSLLLPSLPRYFSLSFLVSFSLSFSPLSLSPSLPLSLSPALPLSPLLSFFPPLPLSSCLLSPYRSLFFLFTSFLSFFKLEGAQNTAGNHHNALEDSRTRWLPRIRELTENISNNFSSFMARLGCAGEVLLDVGEEDDFRTYGIKIKVRFRDSDRLRELTAQHQSGGERAVSTALYLLALQSLTSVPFRCVDEINQVRSRERGGG